MSRRTTLIATLLAGAVVVAACGSDDDGSSAGGDACGIAEQIRDFPDPDFTDPDSVGASFEGLNDLFQSFASAAPGEIEADAQFFADSSQQLVDAIDAADGDFLAADLAFLDETEAQSIEAGDRLDEWTQRECGFEVNAG